MLKANEVIVLGDFAENYQFLVQDQIQSYHWSKEQCTLHPLIVYFIDGEIFSTILFVSSLIITTTIQILFIKYRQSLVITLKKTFQLWIRSSISLTAVVSNIRIAKTINLCYHQQDFNMDAEWIFFATSHYKSPCDGVGGFVKQYVAKLSLQVPLHNKILSY